MKVPELARVRELFDYDPETGVLTRRDTGRVAGSMNADGYLVVGFDGLCHRAHRIAWFHFHGIWPEHLLDHIDRNRSNNRIANLRPITRGENRQNSTWVKGKLGLRGVTTTTSGKFRAAIAREGRDYYLGTFATPEEAAEAYRKAAAVIHTHNPLADGESAKNRMNGH